MKHSFLFILIFLTFTLIGCSNDIHGQLDVAKNDRVPRFTEVKRAEHANKHLLYAEVTFEGSGEQDARRLAADYMLGAKEHYGSLILKLTDEDGQTYESIYAGNDNVYDFITSKDSEDVTGKEELFLSFYEKEVKDNEELPFIWFSVE